VGFYRPIVGNNQTADILGKARVSSAEPELDVQWYCLTGCNLITWAKFANLSQRKLRSYGGQRKGNRSLSKVWYQAETDKKAKRLTFLWVTTRNLLNITPYS